MSHQESIDKGCIEKLLAGIIRESDRKEFLTHAQGCGFCQGVLTAAGVMPE